MQQVFHVLKFYLHIYIVFLVAESFFAPEIKKKKKYSYFKYFWWLLEFWKMFWV